MIIDGIGFRDSATMRSANHAIATFLDFIERRLGVTIVYEKNRLPFGRDDLHEPMRIAAQLVDLKVIKQCNRTPTIADEVPLKLWWSELEPGNRNNAGGGSVKDDAAAIYSTLAESLERYLWFTERDCFIRPRHATAAQIGNQPFLAPERFSAFSEAQRQRTPHIRFDAQTSFLWIQGVSLVTGQRTYVPAQTVSAAWRPGETTPREPLVRTQVTTGLATWSTQSGARLRGALECIERDAYMIWWFNQLAPPLADTEKLRTRSASLNDLIAQCERYRFRVHIIPLLTDAPTHAVCAMVEDLSSIGPRFSFGLKAHRSLPQAAEGSIMEALRARRFTRFGKAAEHYDPTKGVEAIGHRGRVHYWEIAENATYLERILANGTREVPEAVWENDSEEEHLARIVKWCKEKGYEFVSVPFTRSRKNPTPWHIESVVIPELVPTHLSEDLRHLGGTRLKSVPESFGYIPREHPFIERPHPFC